jgi:hypothetical protein
MNYSCLTGYWQREVTHEQLSRMVLVGLNKKTIARNMERLPLCISKSVELEYDD